MNLSSIDWALIVVIVWSVLNILLMIVSVAQCRCIHKRSRKSDVRFIFSLFTYLFFVLYVTISHQDFIITHYATVWMFLSGSIPYLAYITQKYITDYYGIRQYCKVDKQH